MPYTNVPADKQGKMDRCVTQVMAKGSDKETAIAICYRSVVEGAPLPDGVVIDEEPIIATHAPLAEAGARQRQRRQEYEALETKYELLRKKFRLMQQAIRMIVGLYGGNDEDISGLVRAMVAPAAAASPEQSLSSPAPTIVPSAPFIEALREAFAGQNIADYMVANVHRSFTNDADYLFADGAMSQEQRIGLSSAIGAALDTFNARIDGDPLLALLRTMPVCQPPAPEPKPDHEDDQLEDDQLVASETGSDPAGAPVQEASPQNHPPGIQPGTRELIEAAPDTSWLDADGNLDGVIVVEGESGNGNIYTPQSLQSGMEVFKGKPIYADHPKRSEETDRPERSIRDLVGRIIETYLGTDKAGRPALRFKGKLSESADWLRTLIREQIAGDMSINAVGKGHEDPATAKFVVEGFANAISLDFVTNAAAGGYATLVESASPNSNSVQPAQAVQQAHPSAPVQSMEASNMPKISIQEAQRREKHLIAALRAGRAQARKAKAEQIVTRMLGESQLPAASQQRIRKLVEADVRKFAEADDMPIAPVGADMSAGDPPTVELPPDAADLPAEAQKIFLAAYVEALPNGQDQALHIAWAAVYSAGYYKDESGAWQQNTPDLPSDTPILPEALQASVAEAIRQEREYLQAVTGAGRISGLGGGNGGDSVNGAGSATPDAGKSLEEAFSILLPPEQAKIAARGRR